MAIAARPPTTSKRSYAELQTTPPPDDSDIFSPSPPDRGARVLLKPSTRPCLSLKGLLTPPGSADSTTFYTVPSVLLSPRSKVACDFENLRLKNVAGQCAAGSWKSEDESPRKRLRFSEHVVEIDERETNEERPDDDASVSVFDETTDRGRSPARETNISMSIVPSNTQHDQAPPSAASKRAKRKKSPPPPTPQSPSSPTPTIAPLTPHPSNVTMPHAAKEESLWWDTAEITGHLLLSPPLAGDEDDGTGINGIGFKPTPAEAAKRRDKRKRQVQEWKARVAREDREARMAARQRGARNPGGGVEGSKRRSRSGRIGKGSDRAVLNVGRADAVAWAGWGGGGGIGSGA